MPSGDPALRYRRCPLPHTQQAPAFRPLYLQLRDLLLRGHGSARMAARRGDAQRDRAGRALSASRKARCARRSIALAADNLVVRRQGKGTFVATHTEERRRCSGFLRIRRSDGRDEYPASRLHRCAPWQGVGRGARDCSSSRPRKRFSSLRRVLEYGGEPVVLDDITLPAALFKRLDRGPGSTPIAARCTDSSKHSSACACCGRRKG